MRTSRMHVSTCITLTICINNGNSVAGENPNNLIILQELQDHCRKEANCRIMQLYYNARNNLNGCDKNKSPNVLRNPYLYFINYLDNIH